MKFVSSLMLSFSLVGAVQAYAGGTVGSANDGKVLSKIIQCESKNIVMIVDVASSSRSDSLIRDFSMKLKKTNWKLDDEIAQIQYVLPQGEQVTVGNNWYVGYPANFSLTGNGRYIADIMLDTKQFLTTDVVAGSIHWGGVLSGDKESIICKSKNSNLAPEKDETLRRSFSPQHPHTVYKCTSEIFYNYGGSATFGSAAYDAYKQAADEAFQESDKLFKTGECNESNLSSQKLAACLKKQETVRARVLIEKLGLQALAEKGQVCDTIQ